MKLLSSSTAYQLLMWLPPIHMALPMSFRRRSTGHFYPRPATLKKSRTPFCGFLKLPRERSSSGIGSAPQASALTKSTPSQSKCKPACWKPSVSRPTPNSSKVKPSALASFLLHERASGGAGQQRICAHVAPPCIAFSSAKGDYDLVLSSPPLIILYIDQF